MRARRVLATFATALVGLGVTVPAMPAGASVPASPELVSLSHYGRPALRPVVPGPVSDGGRWAAFVEHYDNPNPFPEPGDPEHISAVHVFDRNNPDKLRFRYVEGGTVPPDGFALSGNGRYFAVFQPRDDEHTNEFISVYDLVNVHRKGLYSRGGIGSPSLSDTGRKIAYLRSEAGPANTVFVTDLATDRTTRVSNPASPAFSPVISGDGTMVAYRQYGHVFAKNLVTGRLTKVDVRADGSFGTRGNARPAAFSANGQWLLFTSAVSDLAPGTAACVDGTGCAFRRNLTGAATTVASRLPNGTITPVGHAHLSGDGRVAAFDALGGDAQRDVYVRVFSTARTRLASVNGAGQPANAPAFHPMLTGDGSLVAFGSGATNFGYPDLVAEQMWVARGK